MYLPVIQMEQDHENDTGSVSSRKKRLAFAGMPLRSVVSTCVHC